MRSINYVLDHTGKPYLKIFEEISAIPRGSFKEKVIADYVIGYAKRLGLRCYRDDFNNVVIYKDATPGYEDHETIMLQGHMDMIWEKRPGSNFNFDTDPLELMVKDGYLMAKETTCGSDDGVAVAYMLSILEEKEWKHPALECVFTAAEEVGLVGALKFDCSQLKARKMISMDGNTEGTSLVLSAGAVNGDFVKKISRYEVDKAVMKIGIEGLQGGHSAAAMNKEGENAIKVLARIMHYIRKETDIRLDGFEGGTMSTVPSSASASFAIDEKSIARATEIAEKIMGEVKFEHKESDPGISFSVSSSRLKCKALSLKNTDDIISLLYLVPSGCINRSLVFNDLPVTTANLEIITITEDTVTVRYKPKSALKSKMLDQEEQAHMLAELYGFDYVVGGRYFGHNVPIGTPLYNVFKAVYKEETGKDLIPIGAHYGNEIGTFLEKMPYLDVILLVATHYAAHTPDEKLDLKSFDMNYIYLRKILERI